MHAKMRIPRGVFQILGTVIMAAIAYVWLFIETERTMLIVILVSLFVLLSLEYIREGYSQKKSRLGQNTKQMK